MQRHPWLLHRAQADHIAFGIDHEGNVAVLANQRESTSPNPQPREQTLPEMGPDMCAKPLQQGRATDRVDGILGFACHVKEPRLEMDHRWGLTSEVSHGGSWHEPCLFRDAFHSEIPKHGS